MTARVSHNVAAIAPATKDAPAPTSPRKRRRRAPTTGAADDCFACQDVGSTCDRRRPYCTPCIERGKTCSGYKTQLTWGVGVASRGKLRGLSLPVAKSKKAMASERQGAKRSSVGSIAPKSYPGTSVPKSAAENIPTPPAQPAFSAATPTATTFGFVNVDPNAPLHSPATSMPTHTQAQYDWPAQSLPPRSTPLNAPSIHGPRREGGMRRHSVAPLHVPPPIATPDWSPMPMTAGVFGGFGDSALSDSPTTPSYHGPDPIYIPKSYPQSAWQGGSFPESYGSVPSVASWQSDAISSSMSSETASVGYHEGEEIFYADPHMTEAADRMFSEHRFSHNHESQFHNPPIKEEPTEDDPDVEEIISHHNGYEHNSMVMPMNSFQPMSAMLVGKTPALRQLINYYDKVIAPVIVAFDSPTNPYRTHILRMAHESEALQHAIAALSASNLRMRRDTESLPQPTISDTPHETTHDVSVRKSSIAHNMLRDSIDQSQSNGDPGKPSATELYHKRESIKALNMSLARGMDSPAANDDTVLATLLVLCLYHICDTGIAKFKTQFAGVKKLMALRTQPAGSSGIQWLLTMFQWFDAMTATVNDREGQFESTHPFTPPLPSTLGPSEWSLENLAGCDSRLFKIISQLGRLNLLSQGKPVYPSSNPSIRPLPPRHPSNDYYSLPTPTTPSFDGNGWALLLPDPDAAPMPDRVQFNTEWAAVRQQLLDWRFDGSTLPQSMHAASGTAEAVDLGHISESFRYSALLYTERLAHPKLPSSSPNFQSLVQRAIAHIRLVKSDVYLLWPLFITGTECVIEEDKELIRARCRAIQSDSGFYNNESTLGLLERVWNKNGFESEVVELEGEESPFRWRKEMRREDGEYIVI